jgi:hypothetical protein
MIFGALIVWFLIVEPHGLAKLWSIGKQKNAAVALPALIDRPRGYPTIFCVCDPSF